MNTETVAGTYIPLTTLGVNTSVATPSVCHWVRYDSAVRVYGELRISTDLENILTQVIVSLPIDSIFLSIFDVSGFGSLDIANTNSIVSIIADIDSNSALISLTPEYQLSETLLSFTFEYIIK